MMVAMRVAGCALLLAGCGASLNNESATALGGSGGGSASPATTTGAVAGTASGGSEAARVADKLTAVATPGSTAYKIGPLDVLEITVFKVPELSKSTQVADTGTINLPLVGEVPAAGQTAQEIERDLTKKLGSKYLQNPQVTVFVKEYNSQRVTVEGAVKKPGVYPIRGRNSLLQFIATAEGLDPGSDDTVVIFRQTDGKRTAARFDIDAIRSGSAEDPIVQSGDVIVAGSSALKEGFNNFLKLVPVAGVFALL
ncbi:MAG: polysaccharide biosynthesis/export family protein [Hyphomicrobium sp.]